MRRLWHNLWTQPVSRWPSNSVNRPVALLAEHRSPLWQDGRAREEFGLVAGKVHNLRLAANAFHGVEVPGGETLSFWKQLGRISARRGFVLGREVREGCVVPSLGGGLCQFSNALATCAMRAGMTLVERHGHTHRIEQASAASSDAVDATVFWNYVDLRLCADIPWRIEVELTAEELVVRLLDTSKRTAPLKTAERVASRVVSVQPVRESTDEKQPVARGCLTCQQTECFRHRETWPVPTAGRIAVLLDAWTPELEQHVQSLPAQVDAFVPRTPQLFGVTLPGRIGWGWPRPHVAAWSVFFWRSWWSRWYANQPGRRQAAVLDGQHALARAYGKKLRPEHVHLVVDQALLIPLWQAGHLAGRRYDVWMHSLPMREIHARLQRASQQWPQDPTLRDFRADGALLDLEDEALRHASSLVTCHREVARVMRARLNRAPLQSNGAQAATSAQVLLQPWLLPTLDEPGVRTSVPVGPIVWAASALGRKGLHELVGALQGWQGELWVLGSPASDLRVWRGLKVRYVSFQGDWWRSAQVLVMPAHVEHTPRAALKALVAGVPVVASRACGIADLPGVCTVEAGDVEGLRQALAPWTGVEPLSDAASTPHQGRRAKDAGNVSARSR